MRTNVKLLMVGALLAFGSAACSDFLSGKNVTTDPNAPSAATRDQRLVAVQAAMTVQLTGTLARAACMFIQQCSGVDRQYATLAKYNTTEDDFDTEFSQVWAGGGLVDIRAIRADATAAGDQVYDGIAKVIEALDVGTAADLWGDIPYSEAVGTNPTPHYDTQLSVYTALLTLLSGAITELQTGSGSGPGAVDLWYAGNKTKWTELAHTLKARIYLHLAEQQGTSAYASALTEARLGISTPANDLVSFQSATTSENNMWYQFQVVQRDSYLRMGSVLVDRMKRRAAGGDPRLASYFSTITASAWAAKNDPTKAKYTRLAVILDPNGNFEQVTAVTGDSLSGATQPTWATTIDATTTDNHVTWANQGPLPYFGSPPGGGGVPSNLSAVRIAPAFRQPLATHAEVQLIIAEAEYQAGSQTTALDSLNAERTAAGFTSPLTGLSGPALLDSIMSEKYVVTFQNIEAWNDYKRTCFPALTPASGTEVIGRPLYGSSEINTNPNFPGEPASGRNWNDPNPCP